MTRALLITNPFAARADARAVTAILKILGRGGWNVDLQTITGPGDARRIAEGARGAGFDVQLMADTGLQAKRRWKLGAYLARAAMTLNTVRSAPHRVTVDGTVHEVPAAMLLVLNCGQLPPGFLTLRSTLAPDDGWLDVVALDADGVFQSVSAVIELLLGNGEKKGRRVWWA